MEKTTVKTDENNGNIKDTANKAETKGEKNDVDEKDMSAAELSLDMSSLKINKQTIDLLIANVIPTTKYFESRFDHMQYQVDRINLDINEFKTSVEKSFEKVDQRFEAMQISMDQRFEAMQVSMDQRFEKVDQRFEAMQVSMDQRFEKVDQRFDKVDQRFESIISSIDRLADKLDGRDERQRNFTIKMFTIAISISILGVMGAFLKSLGII